MDTNNSNSTQKNEGIINQMSYIIPIEIQQFNTEYKKYVIIFLVYVIINVALYIYNPFGIMTKYGGATVFIIMFIGLALLAMIGVYGYFLNPKNSMGLSGRFNIKPENIPTLIPSIIDINNSKMIIFMWFILIFIT